MSSKLNKTRLRLYQMDAHHSTSAINFGSAVYSVGALVVGLSFDYLIGNLVFGGYYATLIAIIVSLVVFSLGKLKIAQIKYGLHEAEEYLNDDDEDDED